jgi:putative chitinase
MDTGEILSEVYSHSTGNCGQTGGPPSGEVGTQPASTPCPTSGTALKTAFPSMSQTVANKIADLVNQYGVTFGLDSEHKLRHFLSQAAAETGGLGNLNKTESLDYSSANRLAKVYSKHYSLTDPNKRNPNNYLHNAEAVANYVYRSRGGNGDEASGDGYKYRGRGIFQLTFKNNYASFQDYYNNKFLDQVNIVSNPSLVASNTDLAVLSALWFFKTKVMSKITIDANTSVKSVTKKINGGKNGLSERENYYQDALSYINCL